LQLQLWTWGEQTEPSPSGPRTTRVARKSGAAITVKGPAKSWFDPDYRRQVEWDIVGHFAMTPNVPRQFWELWLEQYRDSDLVKNRVVWASDAASAKSWVREHEKLHSDFSPLDPNDPMARGGRDRLITERADR
jgi:hypothetical protein